MLNEMCILNAIHCKLLTVVLLPITGLYQLMYKPQHRAFAFSCLCLVHETCAAKNSLKYYMEQSARTAIAVKYQTDSNFTFTAPNQTLLWLKVIQLKHH